MRQALKIPLEQTGLRLRLQMLGMQQDMRLATSSFNRTFLVLLEVNWFMVFRVHR